MAKNLEEVRDDLYALFNVAAEKAKTTKSWQWTNWGIAAQVTQSAAHTAEAIAAVEREIRERDEGAKQDSLKKGLG